MSLVKKIKKTYYQESSSVICHAASVATSTGIGAIVTKLMESQGSAAVSAVVTPAAAATYWNTFISLLAYHDRDQLKNADGSYDRKKIAVKAGEYAAFIGIGELAYSAIRGVTHYTLQNRGMDPITASVITDLSCAIGYALLIPPIRKAIPLAKQWAVRAYSTMKHYRASE